MRLFRGEQEGERTEEGPAGGECNDEGVGGAVDLLEHGDHDAEGEQAARRVDPVEYLGPLGVLVGIVQVELIPSRLKTLKMDKCTLGYWKKIARNARPNAE